MSSAAPEQATSVESEFPEDVPNAKTWRDRGKVFLWSGHRIFYRDEGAGPVLLCLHGFPSCSMDWWRLWPKLTARYRVIAPDFIGYGFSAKPTDYHYSIFDQASICEALCASLGIHEFQILAHDFGDSVALEMVTRFGERAEKSPMKVRDAVLLNGGIFMEVTRPRRMQYILKSSFGPFVARLMSRGRFGRSFSEIFGADTQPSEGELDLWWGALTFNKGRRVIHLLIKYIDERIAHQARWTETMKSPPVPMRLIIGTADPVSGENIAAHYETVVPNPDVIRLSCGHYPQTEDPKGIWNALEEFWN